MSFDKLFDGSDAHLLPSSPAECAAFLRRFNVWRRGEDESIEMPNPKEIGFAIAMAAELIDPEGEEIVFTEQQKNMILRNMVNSFQGQFDEIDKMLGLTTGENDPSDIARTREAITNLIRRRNELLAALEGLTGDVQDLIGESYGVVGLHLNGDVSPWDELEGGGRFERLIHLPIAHATIASVKGGAA